MLAAIIICLLAGCIKTGSHPGSASLTIVNAINNSNPIVTNFGAAGAKDIQAAPLQYYVSATQIPYASAWETGNYTGPVFLSLSQLPDTPAVFWSGGFVLAAGSVHTLYLSGDTTGIDTLFTTDYPPFYPAADSVTGVRFVDLVPGSGPISINIQGNPPTQTEFGNLSYKGIADFKQYPAGVLTGGSYIFEIRDQGSGNLLFTFTWNFTPFKNNTIVVCGSEAMNTSTQVTAFQVNNF
jgi:hypothetical protein